MTTISSREFNRDVSAAKRAAESGPVTITDHGRRSHVLLSVEDFDRLAGRTDLVGSRLRMAGAEEVDLPVPERGRSSSRRIPEL